MRGEGEENGEERRKKGEYPLKMGGKGIRTLNTTGNGFSKPSCVEEERKRRGGAGKKNTFTPRGTGKMLGIPF